MRIVSLLPSATEIVYALGLGDRLAGVSHECDFPPEAGRKRVVSSTPLPQLGGAAPGEIDAAVSDKVGEGEPLYVIDEAAIREIKPDLILAQDLCRVCAVQSGEVSAALDKIGWRCQVVSLDPPDLQGIFAGIEEVAEATGRPQRGRLLTTSLRERVRAVRDKVAGLERVRTLALEWLDPPYVGGHWVPEMVELAGGVDVLGARAKASRRVAWRDIGQAAPEVVICMPCGYGLADATEQARALYDSKEFRATPAAEVGRVYAADASSYLSRPGPRIVDGLEIVAWALHPEVFPEPPPGRILKLERAAAQ